MNLIVNADDFGLTRSINRGILEGMLKGIVTSCTMVAAGAEDAFAEAAKLYQAHKLDIGVHLALTMGRPVLKDVPTLVNADGNFYKLGVVEERLGSMDMAELKAEFMAQIERIRNAGIVITHLDSHHHVHMLPGVSKVYLEIAKEQGLPYRGFTDGDANPGKGSQPSEDRSGYANTPGQLITDFYGDGISEELMFGLLGGLTGDSAEIMCHPSYVDAELESISRYCAMREVERKVLTSPKVRAEVERLGIKLIGYREFAG